MTISDSDEDGLARIKLSFQRSRVRRDCFDFLVRLHPEVSYPAEIAREIGSTPSNVGCALVGAPWGRERFNKSYSLAALGLVEEEEIHPAIAPAYAPAYSPANMGLYTK